MTDWSVFFSSKKTLHWYRVSFFHLFQSPKVIPVPIGPNQECTKHTHTTANVLSSVPWWISLSGNKEWLWESEKCQKWTPCTNVAYFLKRNTPTSRSSIDTPQGQLARMQVWPKTSLAWPTTTSSMVLKCQMMVRKGSKRCIAWYRGSIFHLFRFPERIPVPTGPNQECTKHTHATANVMGQSQQRVEKKCRERTPRMRERPNAYNLLINLLIGRVSLSRFIQYII